MNRSAPAGPVVPVLVYEDVGAAADWLCAAFGFVERLRLERDGRVANAQLNIGDGSVMLTAARRGQSPEWMDSAELRPPRAGEVSHMLVVPVANVDAHREQAEAHGARVIGAPTDYPFGERQYTTEDPAGHRWTFSESIADIDPNTWATVSWGRPAPPYEDGQARDPEVRDAQ